MKTNELKLNDHWINQLIGMPESGMGFQLVKVILKGGKVLNKHKVLNSSVLLLDENEHVQVTDIEKIELEN